MPNNSAFGVGESQIKMSTRIKRHTYVGNATCEGDFESPGNPQKSNVHSVVKEVGYQIKETKKLCLKTELNVNSERMKLETVNHRIYVRFEVANHESEKLKLSGFPQEKIIKGTRPGQDRSVKIQLQHLNDYGGVR